MPSPLIDTDPTVIVVPLGSARMKVTVPVGLSPPFTVTESLNTAVPTTPPAETLAVVLIEGLASTVVSDSFLPSSTAPLFSVSPV